MGGKDVTKSSQRGSVNSLSGAAEAPGDVTIDLLDGQASHAVVSWFRGIPCEVRKYAEDPHTPLRVIRLVPAELADSRRFLAELEAAGTVLERNNLFEASGRLWLYRDQAGRVHWLLARTLRSVGR